MKLTLACLLVMALVAGAACAQTIETPPEADPTPTAQVDETPPASTPTPTPEATEEEADQPLATITEVDIEAARQAVFAYREALNNYDLEGTLAFLEESHRAEREEDIRSDIGRMEAVGIHLAVEEEAEPTVTADGKVEIYIKIDVLFFGQKDRHVVYRVMKIEGEWKICESEDL